MTRFDRIGAQKFESSSREISDVLRAAFLDFIGDGCGALLLRGACGRDAQEPARASDGADRNCPPQGAGRRARTANREDEPVASTCRARTTNGEGEPIASARRGG